MRRSIFRRFAASRVLITKLLDASDTRLADHHDALRALISALECGVMTQLIRSDFLRRPSHQVVRLARHHWQHSSRASIDSWASLVRSSSVRLTYRQCLLSQFAFEQAGLEVLADQITRSNPDQQVRATLQAITASICLGHERYLQLVAPLTSIPTQWRDDRGPVSAETAAEYRESVWRGDRLRTWPSRVEGAHRCKLLLYAGMCLLASLLISTAFGLLNQELSVAAVTSASAALVLAFVAVAPAVEFVLGSLIRPAPQLRLDFCQSGLADDCRVVLAIPLILLSREQIDAVLDNTVWNLASSADSNVAAALLSDHPDSPVAQESISGGALCDYLEKRVLDLRGRGYAISIIHRERTQYLDARWIGWERKRGKLLQLNEVVLNGRIDASMRLTGDVGELLGARFVFSLDEDSRLSRDCVQRLAGVLAHPLNRPELVSGRVVRGYGLVVPRFVTRPSSLRSWRLAGAFCGPVGCERSPVSKSRNFLFDWTARTQYPGKGMYDVWAFQEVCKNLPEGKILSHDTIEGALLRCAYEGGSLVSESFPASPASLLRRVHRWARGDIQNYLMFWLLRRERPSEALIRTSFAYMVNMQLVGMALPAALSAGLVVAAFQAAPSGSLLLFLGLAISVSPLIQTIYRILVNARRSTASDVARDVTGLVTAVLIRVAGCWTQAWVVGSAVVHASVSVAAQRHLLEWQPAAAQDMDRSSVWRINGVRVASAVALGLSVVALLVGLRPLYALVFLAWASYPGWITAITRRARETTT